MPTQVEKIRAHAGHLLDAFLQLRQRYALLHPMLFLEDVPKTRGSGKQQRGFIALRFSLFLSCTQDIANLSFDEDHRTPSIKNLLSKLDDQLLCLELRENYSQRHNLSVESETDPLVVGALNEINKREEIERLVQFDQTLIETRSLWHEFKGSPYLKAIQTIRDKVAAHTEIQFVSGNYQLVDISSLGLKWSEIQTVINKMQHLVENLGLLIRGASFAWKHFDKQIAQASIDFWLPSKNSV